MMLSGMVERDWKAWWNESPLKIAETEVYHQVGRTVAGAPTGEQDIQLTANAILAALQPLAQETILDLCCGNGLVSLKLAPFCARLVGVDYSLPLIEIARKIHARDNILYICRDVTQIASEDIGAGEIDAACMAGSFQYFDAPRAHRLLECIRSLASSRFRLFLEGIPDEERLSSFYNTPERMAEYSLRKAEGNEAIGNWWRRGAIVELAKSEGFGCEIIEQEAKRVSSHYRFDALLTLWPVRESAPAL